MTALGQSLRRAASKARRHPGRVVYAVRDAIGGMHELLALSIHGELRCAMAADRDGRIVIVRHP